MNENDCICVGRERFPTGPRQGPDHVGVRFGDASKHEVDVYRDGVKLLRCWEALAGNPGWTIDMIEPLQACPTPHDSIATPGGALCSAFHEGRVEIRRTVTA